MNQLDDASGSVGSYEPEPGDSVVSYPDTTAGTLMRQRDELRAAALSAQSAADQYAAIAAENTRRAAALQLAVDAIDVG